MKFFVSTPQVRKDFERVKMLHWGHFSLLTIALVLMMFNDVKSLWNVLTILILVFFYKAFFKTIKDVLYTFWTLTAFLTIYLSIGLVKSYFIYSVPGIFYAHLLALVLLGMEAYILASPVYFPRVKWWEYDFRYRHDIKSHVIDGDEEIEVRLSDLRRDAGCLVSFDDFKLGDPVEVKLPAQYDNALLKGCLVSKRIYSIGRGYIYGVLFEFSNNEEKYRFERIQKKWHKDSSFKMSMKFTKVKNSEQS